MMKLRINKKTCLIRDLKVPKGFRLIEDYEALKEIRNNKELLLIMKKGWIYCNGIEQRALVLGVSGSNFRFNIYASNIIDINSPARGVWVKKVR